VPSGNIIGKNSNICLTEGLQIMTARHRFFLFITISIYTISVALLCIGFVFGCRYVLGILFFIFSTLLVLFFAFVMPMIVIARKKYKEMPPRMMYDKFSKEGNYCRLDNIERYLIQSVQLLEDTTFYSHKGISLKGIIEALIFNLSHKNARKGGSTITQQLIKNVYLSPEAKIKRKIIELVMVGRLEKELSKNEILELYLNVIYYGCGQYGISNATSFYYHTTPDKLNFIQCISLAAILPCPDEFNEIVDPPLFCDVRDRAIITFLLASNMRFDDIVALYTLSDSSNSGKMSPL